MLASEYEIKKALPKMKGWCVQNDRLDKETGFIYYCTRLDQVEDLAESNETDTQYAIHRWYNFQCSKWVEWLFAEQGARPNPNEKDHDVDFTLQGIDFDVKVSVISSKYQGNKNLANRDAKKEYIDWLLANASQEGRKHTANKIFVICEDLESKSDIDQMKEKIRAFCDWLMTHKRQYLEQDVINELIYIKKS